MHAATVKIEVTINPRPLTVLNPEDIEQPLIPSHLLVWWRLLSLPDNLMYFTPKDKDFKVTGDSLQGELTKHLQSVRIRKWWSKKYPFEKSTLTMNVCGTSTHVNPSDIILAHDQDHPRGFWKVMQIEKLISRRDGVVCGGALRLPSQSSQLTTLQRPFQLFCLLEISPQTWCK